jgi:PAS domain S-box-containing protein
MPAHSVFEPRLPELFDTHPVPMWVYDPETLHFLAVNPATVAAYGYSEDEFLRMTLTDLLPPEDAGRVSEQVALARDSPLHRSGLWRTRTRAGARLDVEGTSHALAYDGRPARLVMAVDVTERVRVERELCVHEERVRLASRFAGMGVWDWDLTTGRLVWDEALRDLYGLPPDAPVTYRDWAAAVHPDDLPAAEAGLRGVIAEGRAGAYEFRIRRPDGTTRRLRSACGAVTDASGAVVRVVGINLDVTEQWRTSADRERLIRELEDQNAELERFVYTVSHDLKSPLITVKGFVGHLGKSARAGNWERFDADLARVGKAAEKMRQLLDDLLQLSRVGRVANPPRDTSVAAAAGEALQQLAGPVAARGATVTVQSDMPAVHADPARLTEVFVNLIGNAVKFMVGQPRPCVEVGFRRADGAFYVSDNGIGIDPAYHSRVFTLFERLDPASEGTGVGLAIVKRIVEVHGGRIWVESAGGGAGATFCFTLPPAREQDATPEDGPAGGTHPSGVVTDGRH